MVFLYAIDKSDMLNIQKYITVKNNIKNGQAYQTSVDCITEFK